MSNDLEHRFPAADALSGALETAGYLAGDQLAAALFLSVRMGQPILLEGEPGVGKTEAAKALAIRLAEAAGEHIRSTGRTMSSRRSCSSCWPRRR